MSDAVLIALLSNLTTIIVVVGSRWISHREHKQTEATVNDTNTKVTAMTNGSH